MMKNLVDGKILLHLVILFFVFGYCDYEKDKIVADSSESWTKVALLSDDLYYNIINVTDKVYSFEKDYSIYSREYFLGKGVGSLSYYNEGVYIHPFKLQNNFFYSVGKKENNVNNEIWVLSDSLDMDSLYFASRKGQPIPLDNFTKLSLDDQNMEIILHNDFFLYKSDDISAICNVAAYCYLEIACVYQKGDSLSFGSIPFADRLIPSKYHYCATESYNDSTTNMVLLDARTSQRDRKIESNYSINGSMTAPNFSTIVIKNHKPTLQLKGKH